MDHQTATPDDHGGALRALAYLAALTLALAPMVGGVWLALTTPPLSGGTIAGGLLIITGGALAATLSATADR